MLIIWGVIVISMKGDTDEWSVASSGAVDEKHHRDAIQFKVSAIRPPSRTSPSITPLRQIAQVRAQVMFWDNSTGLWGRTGGGGISNVCLFKVFPSVDEETDDGRSVLYYIQARRICDDNMLLDCHVTKDLEYTCVNNSMLHHWCVGGSRYGLTFQSPSEASLFHEAVSTVLQLLKSCASQKVSEGMCDLPKDAPHKKAQPIHLKTLPGSEIKNKSLVHRSLRDSDSSTGLSLIPEEGPELIPPPKIIHSTTYGTVKKPRAKTPPASPSQFVNLHVVTGEPNSSTIRFQEHFPLDQWGGRYQSTSQAMTNEYIPSPHRMTLSSYKYNDRIGRNVLLKNEQDLAEKETLVVETGLSPSLGRRNSFQSVSEAYVHLTKNDPCGKHDYSYPTLYSVQNRSTGFNPSRPDPRVSSVVAPLSTGRAPVREIVPPPSSPHGAGIPLPKKATPRRGQRRGPRASATPRRSPSSGSACTVGSSPRVRCLYCQEHFTPEEMSRGRCKDAPDGMLKCIDTITCRCCADAALYHCTGEEDFDPSERGDGIVSCGRNCKRGTVLALVCMLLPCLWCYPVLRACHRCAVRVGRTGPRHRPVSY